MELFQQSKNITNRELFRNNYGIISGRTRNKDKKVFKQALQRTRIYRMANGATIVERQHTKYAIRRNYQKASRRKM